MYLIKAKSIHGEGLVFNMDSIVAVRENKDSYEIISENLNFSIEKEGWKEFISSTPTADEILKMQKRMSMAVPPEMGNFKILR